jgi:hypothetical protein
MGRPRKIPVTQSVAEAQPELVASVEAVQVVAPVVEKPSAGLYRVTRGVFFNQFGASQWLEVGTLIDESVVGAAHIAELKRHRIPLQEV